MWKLLLLFLFVEYLLRNLILFWVIIDKVRCRSTGEDISNEWSNVSRHRGHLHGWNSPNVWKDYWCCTTRRRFCRENVPFVVSVVNYCRERGPNSRTFRAFLQEIVGTKIYFYPYERWFTKLCVAPRKEATDFRQTMQKPWLRINLSVGRRPKCQFIGQVLEADELERTKIILHRVLRLSVSLSTFRSSELFCSKIVKLQIGRN